MADTGSSSVTFDAESPLRTPVVYTLLTYAVSWSSWSLWAVLSDVPTPVQLGLFVLGGLGPFLVALY